MVKIAKFQPVIKWSGSKRSQAKDIVNKFPKEIDVYYEPFCGGASVLRQLLESDVKVNKYICSDLNDGLINLWNEIKNNPDLVADRYGEMWHELNRDDDKNRKRDYFNMVRSRFNKDRCPLDFMFIMRTTTNGMPRYNQKGEFNNSFHITRSGIKPETLRKVILEWSELLNKNNVWFVNQGYESVNAKENDFMYLDPPYANTKGMYYGALDYETFWSWLRDCKGKYALSFNGISGDIDNTYAVPSDIYSKHEYLLSGNSSFKRTIGKSNDSIVYESLYLK